MTQEEKKALQRWAEHHKALAADIPVDDGLSARDIEKKRAELEKDPVEWIRYFSRNTQNMTSRRSTSAPSTA